MRAYNKEARAILSKALEDRCPATAEAIGELPMTPQERKAVKALAALLHDVDRERN